MPLLEAPRPPPFSILLAEDDEDDRLLVKEAFRESQVTEEIHCVADGEELMDYLLHRGKFAGPAARPLPHLILLDLKMPRKDGREALEEIKANPALRSIPIVVLTTSSRDEDIRATYDLGVNSFIVKPAHFSTLVEVTRTLRKYWFETVELPPGAAGAPHAPPPLKGGPGGGSP